MYYYVKIFTENRFQIIKNKIIIRKKVSYFPRIFYIKKATPTDSFQ